MIAMTISKKHYEAVALEFGKVYATHNMDNKSAYAVFAAMQEAFVKAMDRTKADRFNPATFKAFAAEVAQGLRDADGKRIEPEVTAL